MTRYSTEFKNDVIRFHQEGKKVSEIVDLKKISDSSVRSIIERYNNHGTVETPRVSGRPRIFSEREERAIEHTMKENRRKNAHVLADEAPKEASSKTISRILKKRGYRRCVARRKPFLKSEHKTRRLQFAKKYVSSPPEFWKRVIFTDESSFDL